MRVAEIKTPIVRVIEVPRSRWHAANGCIEWREANGKTLDEVKRQGVGSDVLGG